MAEHESFFRRVVRFVANPTTDWTELASRQDDTRELELEKSELKAMIERKRRNDFVRKREFDMLRRVRREGLTPEQLAALGSSSRLNDSEVRLSETSTPRHDGVKAKIDAIEQQMVGDAGSSSGRGRIETTPRAHLLPEVSPAGGRAGPATSAGGFNDGLDDGLNGGLDGGRAGAKAALRAGDPAAPLPLPVMKLTDGAAPAPVQMSVGLPPLSPPASAGFDHALAVDTRPGAPFDGGFDLSLGFEVNAVVHDPELDEAVIAFANADFQQCEDVLRRLTQASGQRHHHAETWLVLFDLYRATGQQHHFESMALDYAQQFGWSAPQWYSLPRLVADAQAEAGSGDSGAATRSQLEVGWQSPERLDTDAVARLASQTLQMPLPWVFDWSALQQIEPEAATALAGLMRGWAVQPLELRWQGGDQLFRALAEAAPPGVRDADPTYWLTRMEALRLVNRIDQFDEAAIEYCITYEVSPPSWEPTRCKVVVSGSQQSTRTPPMSVVSDVSTSFMESALADDLGGALGVEVAHAELSGQLVGDIGATLTRLHNQLGGAPVVSVSCARLIRVDFIAAGDLLNWVTTRRSEGRAVHFVDTHRLVALFFCAMSINEHARVQVRKV